MIRAAILISGRGSNMQALLDAQLDVEWALVLSNVASAGGLEIARARGVPTEVVSHHGFATREAFDTALLARVQAYAPDLVVLAGFMRVLTPVFLMPFAHRLLNIHPSLLPAFPGLNTHARALHAGVKLHGATVHFVTEAVDHGPIVIQAAVPVLPDDDSARLAARVLRVEHQIYPRAVAWFAAGRIQIGGEIARVAGDSQWLCFDA
jgi:phosphoribosylglycinamide formyltransferase-1